MIDILYNGILVGIVLLWVLLLRTKGMGRIVSFVKRMSPAITVALWAVFVIFAVWYMLNFSSFEDMHDIDDAVETAVVSARNDINPYEEYVVPRFKGKYYVGVDWTLGPYNYMPLDLVVYIGAQTVLGSMGTPMWFVVANMVFMGAGMLLLRDITRVPWLPFVPMAGTVMLFYSMDNASLTFLFMVSSMYVLQRLRWHPEALALLIMGLAVMTKVYAAIPFLVMLLFFAQSSVSARDWRKLSAVAIAAAASGAIAVLLMLPFGISDVLDAAVFFHTSEASRVGTSSGGTLLSEIAIDSEYFALIGAGLTAAAVVVGLWVRSLSDRVMLVIVTFLLIAVKSSLAPLTVAGLFLAVRMKEVADAKAAVPEPASSSEAAAGAPAGEPAPDR